MLKMRIPVRSTIKSSIVRSAIIAVTAAYLLLPMSASAAQLDVCGATSGTACNNFVAKYINPVVNLLTISIGVFAVISIIVAGIQYSSAGDDPGAVNKAKNRIVKTVIGLLAYIFLFALLNYLIPGGLFS